MTRIQKAIAVDPNISPQALVLYHCPFEFGLDDHSFPVACPEGELPCLQCWNREDDREGEES